ncbi:(2R,3R)-2,3-butanediol dehydrogenase [Halocaridina rubra]|uniref:(2R,3R)-2,3-butanediol dehydrogenase n=1 Tax=Halocaridina rubra TaxID=373956 RepID=A0AAN9AH22_HALRR
MSTFRRLADVNLFGCVLVTKTFLPLVRKAKGRIVNVTSVQGRMSSPLVSAYDLTKYAIEGFSDCLRHELRQFGVKVSVIEPGNFTAEFQKLTNGVLIKPSEKTGATTKDS